jgi:hypothetical protein
MVALPLPDAETVIQPTLLLAPQGHPAREVVKVTVPEPPPKAKEAEVGERVNEQEPPS